MRERKSIGRKGRAREDGREELSFAP